MPTCDGKRRLKGVSDRMKMQVCVGPSRIAGQGLFAAQAITQGTNIIQYTGEKIPIVVVLLVVVTLLCLEWSARKLLRLA